MLWRRLTRPIGHPPRPRKPTGWGWALPSSPQGRANSEPVGWRPRRGCAQIQNRLLVIVPWHFAGTLHERRPDYQRGQTHWNSHRPTISTATLAFMLPTSYFAHAMATTREQGIPAIPKYVHATAGEVGCCDETLC